MADIKQNSIYAEATKTAYNLGKSLSNVSLPKISMPQSPTTNVQPSLTEMNQPIDSSYNYGKLKSSGVVTTPYGGSTNYEQSHQGIDIAMPQGTPIKSLTQGTITEVKTGQVQDASTPSFGNYIVVKTPDNKYIRYSHLDQVWKPVVGTSISQGENLGTEGNTGSTYSTSGGTGSHLDLRIWEAYQGQKKYLNPDVYFSNK